MNKDTRRDLIVIWRLMAMLLIYPISVVAGLNCLVRILSGCCVTLDSWTPEGALGNVALGLPALAALAALWISTVLDYGRIARDRTRFVLVVTGLLTGMAMELLFLRAGFALGAPRFRSPGFMDVWTFAGPLVVAAGNLLLLARSRERCFEHLAARSHPEHRPIPPAPHGMANEVLRPVFLRPFTRAASARSDQE